MRDFLNRVYSKLRKDGVRLSYKTLLIRVKNKFSSPGNFFSPNHKNKNKLVKIKKNVFLFRKFATQRKFNIYQLNESKASMINKKGFLKLPSDYLAYADDLQRFIYKQCDIENILERFDEESKKYQGIAGNRSPIINLLNKETSKDILLNYLTDPDLLSIISSYLGTYPWLYTCDLWISNEIQDYAGTSQNFHMDWEDEKIIKMFFFLDDIDEDTGPFCLLNKKDSETVKEFHSDYYENKIASTRLSDDMVFDCVDRDRLIKATGKAKEIFMVDTCNVLHYGSRKSSKPRLMLSCMYASPFSLNNWNKPVHRKNRYFIESKSDYWNWSLSENVSIKNK